jgi:5-hydroxyisourate hydrolase-like protein (transthyretin family)
LVSGCARQGYPTGGAKDTEPPVTLGCKPANESRHFANNEFYIQFDEYVVLKNAAENVLVSPPMKQKPEYSTKGKGVLVKLNDTLLPNTTYLFQFKEAIADFTEGNLLPSFEYVFSTGADLDTMSLSGHVLDARSGKPWKETVTVMAYQVESEEWRVENGERRTESDTVACSEQPDFVTRCDKEGNFAFHYIPGGKYRLVALEDKNRNLRVDIPDAVAWDTALFEAHPIPDSTQAITRSSNQAITLSISAPDNQPQRITNSEFAEPGRIVITTQKPLQQPTLEGLDAAWRLNNGRDTLRLWCLDPKLDTARFVISDPSGLQDTLKLRYTKKAKGGRRKVGEKENKTPLMRALCEGNKAYYDDLRLAFESPITTVADSAEAEVMRMKDSTVTRCALLLDSAGLSAQIKTTLVSGEKYHVKIAAGLFSDLYGNSSDSLSFDLTPKDYGTLSISIDNKTGFPLVIEVLDKRDTVVQRSSLNTQHSTLRFSHLPAGDYRLRAIIDRNRDGRWTPGDYRQQRQPEQAVMFEKTLSLREKWEMEEHWTVKEETSMKEHQIKAIPFMPEKDRKGSLKPIKEP